MVGALAFARGRVLGGEKRGETLVRLAEVATARAEFKIPRDADLL
jgi:hypothetical protein